MHLKTKVVVLGVLGAVVTGGLVVGRSRPSPSETAFAAPPQSALDLEPAAEGRAVLGRLWFDRLPASARDEETMWIFLAGGLAVQIAGSGYRWTTELFDLERAKNRLELVTLQDGKTLGFSFEVKACDDKPPFNLCLRMSEPLRGNQVLYGFGNEDEAAHRLGWLREARARAADVGRSLDGAPSRAIR